MEFTLAELLMVKQKVSAKIDTVYGEMMAHSEQVVRKDTGETIQPEDGLSLTVFHEQVKNWQNLFVEVCGALAEANSIREIEWNGKTISPSEAIFMLKELQKEQTYFERLKNVRTRADVYDPRGMRSAVQGMKDYSYERVTSANFNTEWSRNYFDKLGREIRKLEVELNKANYAITRTIENPLVEQI